MHAWSSGVDVDPETMGACCHVPSMRLIGHVPVDMALNKTALPPVDECVQSPSTAPFCSGTCGMGAPPKHDGALLLELRGGGEGAGTLSVAR